MSQSRIHYNRRLLSSSLIYARASTARMQWSARRISRREREMRSARYAAASLVITGTNNLFARSKRISPTLLENSCQATVSTYVHAFLQHSGAYQIAEEAGRSISIPRVERNVRETENGERNLEGDRETRHGEPDQFTGLYSRVRDERRINRSHNMYLRRHSQPGHSSH